MKYKIEQWNEEQKLWYEVGESSSLITASTSVKDLKNKDPHLFFRIVQIIDIS